MYIKQNMLTDSLKSLPYLLKLDQPINYWEKYFWIKSALTILDKQIFLIILMISLAFI